VRAAVLTDKSLHLQYPLLVNIGPYIVAHQVTDQLSISGLVGLWDMVADRIE